MIPLAILLAPLLLGDRVPGDANAISVLNRTRETQATYSLYVWNRLRSNSIPTYEEWAAEFNRGHQHRVETPKFRIVADCLTNKGFVFDVERGVLREDPSIGKTACGISLDRPIEMVQVHPDQRSTYGPLNVVSVVDDANERFYAVDARGILVRSSIFPKDKSDRGCLQAETIAIEPQLPAGDIFSRESLARSVVSERYRRPIHMDRPSVAGRWCR